MRKPVSQLVCDIGLRKQQSLDNPVYYVQYAHARICSIFENAAAKGVAAPSSADSILLSRLDTAEELKLVKLLDSMPETVEDAARELEPHRMVYFLTELAGQFHSYYNKAKVVTEDRQLSEARLYLLARTRQVLRNSLSLLGVSAPERM